MNKSKLKEFFMCTRPHSYPASVAPVLFGATYALGYEIKIYFVFIGLPIDTSGNKPV